MTGRLVSVIEDRRARRAITNHPIPRPILETILMAAHWAPSCANNQPWRFIVVDEEPTLTQVKEGLSGGNYWAKMSPAVVAVASKATLDCQIPDGREYNLFGCGLASMNLMLQATDMGLVAHPIAGFRQLPIKEALAIPEEYTLITLIILGYPTGDYAALSEKHQAQERAPRERMPLARVVAWNTFSSLDEREVPEQAGGVGRP